MLLLIIPTLMALVEVALSQDCLKDVRDHSCFLLPITLYLEKKMLC